MDVGLNAAFMQLKPVCDSIASGPTIEKLQELQRIINNTPNNVIQQLHEFIIFPLFINLQDEKTKFHSNLKQEIFDTLKTVLQIVKLKKIKVFLQIYMVIVKQIFNQSNSTLKEIDEELKLSIIDCLNNLFKNISSDLLSEVYSKNYSVHFPQGVYTCIQVIKYEKLRNLRLNAIQCLMTIAYVHDEADFTDKVMRNEVANTMMFFLPGIAIGLRNVALDDEKQGHQITVMALRALSRILVLHMQDDESCNKKEIVFEFPSSGSEIADEEVIPPPAKKDVKEMMKRFQNEERSSKWYKETENNLQKIIESLSPLQHHYHQKVRCELADLCEQILINCSTNMKKSLSDCIEMLIALSEDDDPTVSQKSKFALTKLSKHSLSTTLFEILEENFFNVISRLPRIINGTDVNKQLAALNLLVGYIRLLGPKHLMQVLHSANHLKRLILSLIHISQLERSNISLFEEHAIRDFESISETPVTWKQFKFIGEKPLISKLQVALHLLSNSEAAEIIIDCLCDIFLNEHEHRNEVIFLLNEILSVTVEDIENRIRIITNVLKIYMDDENWYLAADVDDKDNLALFEVHNNIVQICLLVEGIGNIAKALGIQFKPFLFKTLYIVLERAGSAQPLISAAGLGALLNISKACEYENVTNLIVENTDYFSFYVVRKLRKLERNPSVLDVLNVVMKYSTIEVLPSIMDIINGVLLQSCDELQVHNATAFLRVFHSFVQSLRRWMNINVISENRLVKLLIEYKKSMDFLYAMYGHSDNYEDEIMGKTAEEMYKEDMEKGRQQLEEEYNETEEYKKPEPPEHIKLTVSVLTRSLNFLPSKNQQRKLLVLEILTSGLDIISEWEDQLLPLVHLIWSPLVDRFKETNDPLIINRSFELLIVLAKYSKDFIRSRTSKNVFPEICITLKKLSEESYLKDRGSAYRYTQAYKLQMNILKNLGNLITDLDMSIDDVNRAMNAAKPYLSNKQPLPLQESALAFYKSLSFYDIDSVWLHLIEIWGPPIQEKTGTKEELLKNTECLLKLLEPLHN